MIEVEIAEWQESQWPGTAADDRLVGTKLAEEVGEVCGALIKIAEGRRTLDDLADEMGDALISLSALAGRHGWTLDALRERRWAEVSQRQARGAGGGCRRAREGWPGRADVMGATATAEASRGWWTISGDALMDTLRRVADGEDPGDVYADEESKCDREDYRTGSDD